HGCRGDLPRDHGARTVAAACSKLARRLGSAALCSLEAHPPAAALLELHLLY
ncbi:unnamed protein product, partial [Urochloa humidicola]